jgi:uncharacterized protein (TIGR02246 family)
MEAGNMKRIETLIGLTVLALMTAACNQLADTHDADVQAIKDTETQWNQDYAARDADKIVAHYADDAVLITPGMPASNGMNAIRTAMNGMLSDPTLSLKFQAAKVDVAKSGDLGFSEGSYTLTLTDPGSKQLVHDHGSYVTVYRKQADGTWKAVSDIASSEVPPPAPAPAPVAAKKH